MKCSSAKSFLIFSFLLVCFSKYKAQTIPTFNDSLVGFDTKAAIEDIKRSRAPSENMAYFLRLSQRDFINTKYQLFPKQISSQELSFYPIISSKTAAAYCNNEDFENSSPSTTFTVPSIDTITTTNGINGWSAYSGFTWVNTCAMTTSTAAPQANYIIAAGPAGYIDPMIGSVYPIFSVFGNTLNNGNSVNPFPCRGDFFIRLNDNNPGGNINQVIKTFSVTASNSLFKFAQMYVGFVGGHCCCNSMGISVKLKDCSGNLLPSPQFSIVPGNGCSTVACTSVGTIIPTYSGSSFTYSKWNISAFDLTPYIGTCVAVELSAFDCTSAGHNGYGYFDAQCDSMYITWNSQRVSAVSNTINLKGTQTSNFTSITSCASVTDTLGAPDGLAPYVWTGPPGFTTANTQTITTNIAGMYTLSLGGFGTFAPTYKYINLTHTVMNIPISSTNSVICLGDSTIINASGVNSYTWSTGANTPSITVKPNVTTTYTVLGTTLYGCPASAVFTQSVSVCTAINATTDFLSHFSVQPNPNNGEFSIHNQSSLKNGTIEIYNTLGEILLSKKITSANSLISIQNQPDGIYFIKVFEDSNLIYATKIIKR